jgi:hypothetical protein
MEIEAIHMPESGTRPEKRRQNSESMVMKAQL